MPLCAGGVVCIPNEKNLSSAENISHWINSEEINFIHCVPSLFRFFNNALDEKLFNNLKYILLAGEKILPYQLVNWYNTYDDKIQLVNIYGPTETTLAKGYYLIQTNDVKRNFIPIKPISGAQFLLLDKHGNLCPKKVVGEIYIRTPFKTGGYLNLEELNEKSFVVNPFSKDRNDFLYKTGDLGRKHDDEEIEILIDFKF